jgi:hypothetical protein
MMNVVLEDGHLRLILWRWFRSSSKAAGNYRIMRRRKHEYRKFLPPG